MEITISGFSLWFDLALSSLVTLLCLSQHYLLVQNTGVMQRTPSLIWFSLCR